jgi:phosphoglycolate phosphatase
LTTPLRLVIFDVDGTLIDSQAHILAAMARAFDGVGLPVPDRGAVLGVVGLSLPILVEQLAPAADAATKTRIIEGYKQGFADLRAEGEAGMSPLYPGARAVLDRLAVRDDILLAVATGKSRRGMAHVIEMHGLEGVFQSVQTADDHPSKPSPEMIRACLAEFGVAAQDAAILGDTSFDMEMGQNAGVHPIGVTWGYHDRKRLYQAGAVDLLEDFSAVMPCLGRIWGLE